MHMQKLLSGTAAVYNMCVFSVQQPQFYYVMVTLQISFVYCYMVGTMFFCALCDLMSKWGKNALRSTVLQYVIVALYSLLDLRLYSEPDFLVDLFSVFSQNFVVLIQIALTDVSPVTATFLCNLQVSIGVTPVFTETRVYNRAMFLFSLHNMFQMSYIVYLE